MSSGKWRPFCLGLNVLIDDITAYNGLVQMAAKLLSIYAAVKWVSIGADSALSPLRHQANFRL